MMLKCIGLLTAEHKIILRIADVLESMSNRMQSSEYEELDMREILQILRSFGDDFHQAKEESALFPAFTAACDLSQTSAVRLSLISI